MPLIRISERTNAADGKNASLSFDNEGDYLIAVSDPFSENEEALLEWYFEEYLRSPFTDKVQAKTAADSITRYGEAIFDQVFADRNAYNLYKDMLRGGLEKVSIEIAGSPEFHKLHWEAMKDPGLSDALALHATMVRKNLVPQNVKDSMQTAPAINLLIVAARPEGKRDVGYRTISRPLVYGLQKASARVQIDILRPGTYEALYNHLEDMKTQHGTGHYHVIHFDTHGAVVPHEALKQGIETGGLLYNARYGRADIEEYDGLKAFLFLEGKKEGQADPVEASELANLLITHQVPIAILNACESGKQIGKVETSLGSRLMQAGVHMVLAMGYSVTVSAAEVMMATLYNQLFAGEKLSAAIRRARNELNNRKGRKVYHNQIIDLEDWLLPVVYQNRGIELATREFTPDERKAYYERQATSFEFPKPNYGFFGRDLDILQIEKRMLSTRNVLLLRGMGGAGKTTLLKHLGAWWQKTNFVDRVFYFGYDERGWTRQQIMNDIGKRLFSEIEFAGFHPLGIEAQQKMLTERLRGHRHLLILDNLESITGSHLAIRNILPQDEREALQRFLADLADGRSLILLGSRGGESWLADGTFGDNVYDMPGLDAEAASMMADRILERCDAAAYREDANFQRLLKLLNGYPLALEVVLANLARQTPADMLAALEAGDVALDRGDTEKKTESILRCIDYSHSNLSPDAQGLLICLAPFTGVVFQGWMEQYTARLREQSALAHLPFDRWDEVLNEAANWGLVSAEAGLQGYLRLQPIFPYFLRGHLNAPDQSEVKLAVETAFRLHYDEIGGAIAGLLQSKEAQEKQIGQLLARLEYENLTTALNLALAAQVSILNPYKALSFYLDTTQDQRKGLELGETVLARLEEYPSDKLTGQLGAEFVGVLDSIAKHQLLLKQYAAAEIAYKKCLELVPNLVTLDQKARESLKALTYHQLGMVSQYQRRYEEAESYYKQALEIKIQYNDRYSQASTYHQLGRVSQEQEQWEQARDYFLNALSIIIEFKDAYTQGIILGNLRRLWRAKEDTSLPAAIAGILKSTPEEVEEWLHKPDGEG